MSVVVPNKLTAIDPAELPVITLGKMFNSSRTFATPQLYKPNIAPPENNIAVCPTYLFNWMKNS